VAPSHGFSTGRQVFNHGCRSFSLQHLSSADGRVSIQIVLVGDSISALVILQASCLVQHHGRDPTDGRLGVHRLLRHRLYLAAKVATIGSVMQFLAIRTVMLGAV
jgi:hypothetical protein